MPAHDKITAVFDGVDVTDRALSVTVLYEPFDYAYTVIVELDGNEVCGYSKVGTRCSIELDGFVLPNAILRSLKLTREHGSLHSIITFNSRM